MKQALKIKTLHPDSKGRVTLGALSRGATGFRVTVDKKHRIILDPVMEIPLRERWLYENPKALASLRQGLKELAEGKKLTKMSFLKYLDDQE